MPVNIKIDYQKLRVLNSGSHVHHQKIPDKNCMKNDKKLIVFRN